jgi:ribosome-associated protein
MSPPRTTKAKRKPVAKKKGAASPRKKKSSAAKKPARKKAPVATAPAAAPPAENPAAQALARKVAALVVDKKAKDVVVLDVRGIASYADYVVLASGESDRQVAAMASHVQQKLKEEDGQRVVGSEGTETGQWVLLDYGDVVAHFFYDEVRAHYDLEGLWADAKREKVG